MVWLELKRTTLVPHEFLLLLYTEEFTFDDYDYDGDEEEREVEAGVTEAGEGARGSLSAMAGQQWVKKDHIILLALVLQLLLVIES